MAAHLLRLLAAAGLVAGTLVVSAGPAQACSCANGWSLRQLAGDGAVFVAQFLGHGETAAAEGFAQYRVRVERVYQGDVPYRATVMAGVYDSTCGYKFSRGRYLVVSSNEGGSDPYDTTLCSGTRPAERGTADARRAFGPADYPDGHPINSTPTDVGGRAQAVWLPGPPWVPTVVAGLGLAGWLAVRYLRRRTVARRLG